jgi:hypothetical protein
MPKKLPKIEAPKTVTVIRSKGPTVKDPVRYPDVIEPVEKKFTDDYLKMLNSMTKMCQVEMLRQVKN